MTPSQACIDLVKKSEGLRLVAYQNPGDVPTIGWGHTAGVSMGPPPDEITEAQAEAFLAADLAASGEFVSACVKVPLNQNQFDALVDFDFEEGGGHLATSTLLHLLNLGDYTDAADQFGRWVYGADATGKPVVQPGQVTRRAAERTLFLTPITPITPVVPPSE